MADRGRTIKRAALVGAAGLALWLLLRKGKGWGGRRSTASGRPHCKLRLGSAGLRLDGQPVTISSAVARCRGGTAEVAVSGDASYGELQDLRAALHEAGVATSKLIVRFDSAGMPPAGG